MARSKYGNRRVVLDGYTFDSVAEASRYQELLILVAAKLITDLEVHPRFILQESFYWRRKKQQAIYYEGDFAYRENGKQVIEDVKGVKTQVYILKKKLFLYRYPDVHFLEVGVERRGRRRKAA